jgi:hypothetical protein
MTVTQIVEDLLKYNYITAEAATVLLKAEIEANRNRLFIPNAPSTNPFIGAPIVKYDSTGTGSGFPIMGHTTTTTGTVRGLNGQLKDAISNDTI